ncbi:hypothetical protein [Chryseobacterium wanjuense]
MTHYTEPIKEELLFTLQRLLVQASAKTVNINTPGYYFFDGSIWQK